MPKPHRTSRAKGFTLLELVVSISLFALVGTAFVMCLAYAIQNYLTARETTELTQKAHLALTRMYVELAEIQGIDPANSGKIDSTEFYFIDHNGEAGSLILQGREIRLNGNTLVDGLALYSTGQNLFTYQDENDNNWTTGDGFDELYGIGILLRMQGLESGDVSSFNFTVNPRKTTTPDAPKME